MLKGKITSFILKKFDLTILSDLIKRGLLLKILYKIFVQRMISYDFPSHLFIETTSACNLKCKMCARTNRKTLIGHMDFGLFKKIIDEADNYGPRTFSLHLVGEPLLAPNFPQMIQYIKRVNQNNTTLLTTNGTLLNQKLGQAIIEAPVDKIYISFASAEKNNYQAMTGLDKLKAVEKNVLDFIELKKRKKVSQPRVYVRMILSENNKNEEKLFKNKWQDKPLTIEIRPAHNYGGYSPDVSLRKNAVKEIKKYPCYHLWFSPAIHWNGDVSICCNDWGRETVLGNVKNQTLHQIWNSEELKQYRQDHLKGLYHKVPLCEKCDVWTTYEDIFFNWQKK